MCVECGYRGGRAVQNMRGGFVLIEVIDVSHVEVVDDCLDCRPTKLSIVLPV